MNASIQKGNRTALALLLLALVAAYSLLALPAYNFDSCVYTKKSANTFVGDEKYQEVLAEVNAVAEQYRSDGFDVTLNEEVIERTNSKGQQTSMVSFTLSEKFTKSALAFIEAGIGSSWVISLVLLCLTASAACAVLGSAWSMGEPWQEVCTRESALRAASAVLALAAFLLIPVFAMINTYTFSHRIALYAGGITTDGMDALYAKLDRFLFDGLAGDSIDTALKSFTFDGTGSIWGAMACAFVMLLAAVHLYRGEVQPVLLRGLLYAFIAVVCVIVLYPYYVMLITAFRSSAETNDMYFQHIFPTKWEFGNLTHIMSRGVPRYLLNSLLIAGGATVIALLCGIPAAYAMARMRFKGKKFFLGFVIMSQMFSPVVLLIGIAQLMSTLNLSDSIVGLMLINAAFNQAFAIWLLRGTFVAISPEMEQAARIDGCTTVGSLLHVLLPMAAPGIVTTLIFVFINAWNEYTISTVLISTMSNRPITVGITQFSSFNMIEWQYLFAASLLATLPVVILFMCIEKHLTAGLTSGGVKG